MATPPGAISAGLPAGLISRAHLADVLIVFGFLVAYALLVLISPTRRCRCNPGLQRARCRKCGSRGRRYRIGAAAVHRFVWSVLLRRLMEHRRESLADQRTGRQEP